MSTLRSWYYQITVPSVTARFVVHPSAEMGVQLSSVMFLLEWFDKNEFAVG